MKYNKFGRMIVLSVAVIVNVIGFVFVLPFHQSLQTKAADPITSSFSYDSGTNSFTLTVNPDDDADIAIYYRDTDGNINAIFGSDGTALPAETCSAMGACVPDSVTYGVVKAYIPDEQWLYVGKFRVQNGFVILEEETDTDVEPADVNPADYVGSPPAQILLQLRTDQSAWLDNPVEPSPTVSPTPSLTPSITPSPTMSFRLDVLPPPSTESAPLAAAISNSPTPSPTPSDPQVPQACTNGLGWVNEYIPAGTVQGVQNNGLPVPPYRTSPTYGFNAPDAIYYSLGLNGVVTYKFPGNILDIHDVDGEADIQIHEVTIGRSTYPEEKATVQVSQDGVTWYTLSALARARASVAGVTLLDFHETGLPFIQYIRLTDISNTPTSIIDADGFDVNAIGGFSQECPTPSPTVTPSITLTPTKTLTPSPTPADPVPPPICTDGTGYLNGFIEGNQTTQQDGLPVPAYRSLPSYAFGAPDDIYYTLGLGGNATFQFAGTINNVTGTDFSIYEVTLGRSTYPTERATVEVSQDGVTWFLLSTNATSRFNTIGVTTIDFDETGLSTIKYVRMTDVTPPPPGIPEADGFDINAVVAVDQDCPDESVTPTPTTTLTPSPTPTQEPIPLSLTIRKFNNRVAQSLSPGSDITYTIQVTATGSATNVQVEDLPPEGFEYVPGSWTARSNDVTRGLLGDLKAGGITTEPTYASPGTWKLGSMKSGEVVTLTYRAQISGAQDGGVYGDLAWAEADGAVLAQGTNSTYVNNEFVGSEVTVVRNNQRPASVDVKGTSAENRESSGSVLGASTKLPKTGANTWWVIFGVAYLVGGLVLVRRGWFILRPLQLLRKEFSDRDIIRSMVTLACIFGLGMFATSVSAAAVTSIRLSDPQDKLNSNEFRLSFVTLDSEDRPLTVKCWKKGPSDASFVQFGSDIIVQPGGNSGFCNVNSSVVGSNGQSYQFRASAQAAGGAVVFSQTVGTSVSTQTPGTPTNYSKAKDSCTYRITFRTANDSGRTDKVEVYRSENTAFTADNGTKVGEVTADSNQTKTYQDVVGDCNKTYYYVVRAFDSFGNGSGVVGDSEVSVTVVTTSTTTTTAGGTTTEGGALPVAPGQGNVAQPGGAGTAGNQGQVQGAATPEATLEDDGASEEAVLGELDSATKEANTDTARSNQTIVITIIGILLLAVLGYVLLKPKK